ncbi:molybdopterin-guanine dinucleotide biosynthesis protein B [Planococcus antarcticus DSM 14505]|uniref:Molybdopterin-guanine dinucleotide biosynthesis protein B n=1 Tax=Planococcus antarcticus DSM 14505 TaxID=1185653 RepID=A0A1C7DI89_9BACL|nr:molybdopterin-guanine dinucleotide biosynthesis protein B [Planococcus antarcticus]ANU10933.1 molybdopterin-guanine dinucleotide biosynthesis protein B [Planococcus antarcticus DSM 14505]EIM05227.1 molybdopterin-guanine dinucleotide biosynthesis protein B [Planococcus antarcticus DSM 14505]
MDTVKVLQVVGFKNSGKTTVILNLLRLANDKGKKVSTVKHHGHGGALDMPSAATDSMRFFEEGTNSSVVYGGGVVQVLQRKEEAMLDELIGLASMEDPDLILVEGFKRDDYEKIVLLRSAEDWIELQELNHIVLVITPKQMKLDNLPVVLHNDLKQLNSWFTNWMDGDSNEGV